MASCPKCGRRPIRQKFGIRQCRRCGVLSDTRKVVGAAAALVSLALLGCSETYYGCRQHGRSREGCYLSTPRLGRA